MSLMRSILQYGGAFGVGAIGATLATKWEGTKKESNTADHSKHPALKYGVPTSLIPEVPPTLCYSNHCLAYDPRRKTPLWVAEHVSREKVSPPKEITPANRRNSKFQVDPSLSDSAQSSNDDFWDSGWSRGHMAPAGNNKHCQNAMNATFYLSNIVPQDIDNNSDFWNRLEMYCRDLTKKYKDVHIISGPLWLPVDKNSLYKMKEVNEDGDRPRSKRSKERAMRSTNKVVHYEVIGANEVSVPTHLFKVVLAETKEGELHISSFVVPNRPIERSKPLRDFWVPLDRLEKMLGYRLYSSLDRSRVTDLCDKEGCKIKEYLEVLQYFLVRNAKDARDPKELAKLWKKAEGQKLLTKQFVAAFEKRSAELRNAQAENEEKQAAVAG